jgi:hypothetical protein
MTRARGITEEAADAAVDTACRALRLPTIRGQFAAAADKAERDQLTYRGFLAELLMGECEDRDRRRAERQVRGAGFPRAKWLADFDYGANPGISPAVISTLATCDWVRKGQPLCLIGDSGTGKSHLPSRWEPRPRWPGTGFQVLSEREETNSIAIASTASFSEWTNTFTDPRLCAAIVDRAHLRWQYRRDRHHLLPACPHQGQCRVHHDQVTPTMGQIDHGQPDISRSTCVPEDVLSGYRRTVGVKCGQEGPA